MPSLKISELNNAVTQKLFEVYKLAESLHLQVDMREDKPFHCDECGRTYSACRHWFPSRPEFR
jgi:hypothetical protein